MFSTKSTQNKHQQGFFVIYSEKWHIGQKFGSQASGGTSISTSRDPPGWREFVVSFDLEVKHVPLGGLGLGGLGDPAAAGRAVLDEPEHQKAKGDPTALWVKAH